MYYACNTARDIVSSMNDVHLLSNNSAPAATAYVQESATLKTGEQETIAALMTDISLEQGRCTGQHETWIG